MPSPLRFLTARRYARAVVGAACMTGALAFGQLAPPISTPSPASVTPPVSTWRAPMLQVQGAEQPVRLASLQVDVEIAGGAAETRVQMVFFNPNNRILEGKLQFPLAPGQVVSGFALDVDLQRGEPDRLLGALHLEHRCAPGRDRRRDRARQRRRGRRRELREGEGARHAGGADDGAGMPASGEEANDGRHDAISRRRRARARSGTASETSRRAIRGEKCRRTGQT